MWNRVYLQTNLNGSWIFHQCSLFVSMQTYPVCRCACLKYSLEADADKRSELDVHLRVCQVMGHVYRLHCLERTSRGRSNAFLTLHQISKPVVSFVQSLLQWTTFARSFVRFAHPVQQLLWREHLPIFVQPGKCIGIIHYNVVHIWEWSAVILPTQTAARFAHYPFLLQQTAVSSRPYAGCCFF